MLEYEHVAPKDGVVDLGGREAKLVGTGGDSGDEVFARLGGVGLEVGFVHGLRQIFISNSGSDACMLLTNGMAIDLLKAGSNVNVNVHSA